MRIVFFIVLHCLLLAAPANNLLAKSNIPARPTPPRLVNDFANVINDTQEQQLEQKLVAFNDSTSTQIAVVTVTSLNGDAPYNFAHEILAQWGVGQKDKDNGVVVLVAPNERQTFISTGYGVEADLTDARCRRIIENYMIPQFKEGNYYAGIDDATNVIMGILSGQFTPDDNPKKSADLWIALLIFVVYLFIVILIIKVSGSMRRAAGGRTYSGRGAGSAGPVIVHWGDDDFGSFSGGSGSFGGFGGFGGGGGGGGGAGGSW